MDTLTVEECTVLPLHQGRFMPKSPPLVSLHNGATPLKKTTPASTLRYQRGKTIDTAPMSFEPGLALKDDNPSYDLLDWTLYTHPEGMLYYHNPSLHVVTDANLQRTDIRDKISYCIAQFEAARFCTSVELPKNYELLLELNTEEDQCSYYVADHDRRTVFWLDVANTEDLDLPDVSSQEHLKLKLEQQYWIHLEYFPMHGTLPASAESTLMGMLTHAWGDQTTSSLSTAPYSAEQCKTFLAILDRLIGNFIHVAGRGDVAYLSLSVSTEYKILSRQGREGISYCGRFQTAIGKGVLTPLKSPFRFLALTYFQGLPDHDGYKTCVIARLMNEFLHSRFINLYGHPEGARLARNQSTLPPPAERELKLLNTLCSTLLYQFPKELKDLKELWVDNVVYTEHWRAFLGSRLQEWKSLSLLSILLLLVDTLLIINYHTNPTNFAPKSPLVRTGCISGTVSLLLSMSTVIASVTTILIHQPYAKSHASEATVYLDRASHETLGLRPLAIVLSLPRSLFLWALVTGGIALLSFCFQILDTWSVIFLGVFAGGLCVLLVWAVGFFEVRETDLKGSESRFKSTLLLPFAGCFGTQEECVVAEAV